MTAPVLEIDRIGFVQPGGGESFGNALGDQS